MGRKKRKMSTKVRAGPVSAETFPAAPSADEAGAVFARGLQLHQSGDHSGAEAAYREAIRLAPDHPHAYNNLAIILRGLGRLDEAVINYRRAIEVAEDPFPVLNNLAMMFNTVRRSREGAEVAAQAVCLRPDVGEGWFQLGNAVRELGNHERAEWMMRLATTADPRHAPAWTNLGNLLRARGLGREAVMACKQALDINPTIMEAFANVADTLKEQGRVAESVPYYAQAFTLKPRPDLHSNLLLALNYLPDRKGTESLQAHRVWAQTHADPLTAAAPPLLNDRDPDRRLRIGFVSADLRTHSVAFFFIPLLAGLLADEFETFCYSNTASEDITSDKMKQLADHWVSIIGVDDAEVAERIRRDRIDILVDLSGHTGGHRLLIFARRPAPVQVSWLGYPNTTGMRAIDYRLTDAVADPPGQSDPWYTEKLVRLGRGFLCFRPLDDLVPEIEPLAASRNGHVTFGSFNNVSKLTEQVLDLWARVLAAVPQSRLILKNRAFADAFARDWFMARLCVHGVTRDRIDLLEHIHSVGGHLGAYSRIDIGLDPFPYGGTTTTCEAMWMGVPVITLLGEQHAGRVGASLLTQVGLGDWIALDADSYVAKAAALAGNLSRLAALRRTMRRRMQLSPLRDESGFARSMAVAFRDMWHEWCFSPPENGA